MKRVLIINDSRFERLFLKDMIIALGFEVSTTDEYGSLRQVETLNPEMVIVNYTMPGMTGDEVIRRIKDRHPYIKCLLSSCSRLSPENYPLVDGILQTPVDRKELSRMLSTIMVAEPLIAVASDNIDPVASLPAERQMPTSSKKYNFCPFCGQGLHPSESVMSFCPFCGHELSPKA
ncbi:MAG: response regulator transcription factor [Methylocystaceae bacterium]